MSEIRRGGIELNRWAGAERSIVAGLLLVALVGCDSGFGGPSRARDAGGDADGGRLDADAGAQDAGTFDAGVVGDDAGVGMPDSSTADLGVPGIDAGPSCVPTRTSCRPELECGAIPDGCPGGVFLCGDPCGGGETYCGIFPSRWHDRAYNCTQAAQSDHPEWFDPVMFRDTSSWLVLDASAVDYVAFVAACSNSPAFCIVDPNAPANEIRCRGTDDDLAENISVRTYGTGRTVGRYTSTCTPAMF